MSRPKPTILLENVNKSDYKSEQVLAAEAIWAVFYKNNPFNLKSSNLLNNYRQYKKVPSLDTDPTCKEIEHYVQH